MSTSFCSPSGRIKTVFWASCRCEIHGPTRAADSDLDLQNAFRLVSTSAGRAFVQNWLY